MYISDISILLNSEKKCSIFSLQYISLFSMLSLNYSGIYWLKLAMVVFSMKLHELICSSNCPQADKIAFQEGSRAFSAVRVPQLCRTGSCTNAHSLPFPCPCKISACGQTPTGVLELRR